MFICLLKAHPWVLTPTSCTAKRNISSSKEVECSGLVCVRVCVWEKERKAKRSESERESEREGWGGVHHCIKWDWAQGPFCHRAGLICQWWAVRSWGKAGTKVLKGCVTMRVLRWEPSRVGQRLHGTSCANHSAIITICKCVCVSLCVCYPGALCGHSWRGARTHAAVFLWAFLVMHSWTEALQGSNLEVINRLFGSTKITSLASSHPLLKKLLWNTWKVY